jgi:hypothetical protein
MSLFHFRPEPSSAMSAADGKRILVVLPVGPNAHAPFNVLLNWTTMLER